MDKYGEKGFHLVAMEVQGNPEDEIARMVAQEGINYQVTKGGSVSGVSSRGIPYKVLFGPDGKMIADNPGHGDLERLIEEHLKKIPEAMAGPGPYEVLDGLAGQIRRGRSLGRVLSELREKRDSEDPAEAGEAEMMFESLHGAAEVRMERALALKETDPERAIDLLYALSKDFSGDEIGEEAEKKRDELKNDPAVKNEIKALDLWEDIQKQVGRFRADDDPDRFKQINKSPIRRIISLCEKIVEKYPETRTAKRAEEMMKQYD